MRTKTLALGLVLAMLNLGASASGAVAQAPAANNFIFSGGGTPLSNGLFFPGTAVYDEQSKEFVGEPYQIPQGDDVTFTNIDSGAVANAHRIISLKSKKNGRPLFGSKLLDEPGQQDVMKTSHLKPGTYVYTCPIHFGMYGLLKVTE